MNVRASKNKWRGITGEGKRNWWAHWGPITSYSVPIGSAFENRHVDRQVDFSGSQCVLPKNAQKSNLIKFTDFRSFEYEIWTEGRHFRISCNFCRKCIYISENYRLNTSQIVIFRQKPHWALLHSWQMLIGDRMGLDTSPIITAR